MQQHTIVATDEAPKKYIEDTPNKYVMAKGIGYGDAQGRQSQDP